jgi:acyl carrier protein
MNNILVELNDVFKQVFKNEELEISEQTTSEDIERWDSLNNMILVVMIEDHFNIRFDLDEVQNLKNVGDLCACIEKYRNL